MPQPKFKPRSKTDQQTADGINQAVNEILNEFFKLVSYSFAEVFKFIVRAPSLSATVLAALGFLSAVAVDNGYHLDLLHTAYPDLFTGKRLQWTERFSWQAHFFTTYALVAAPVLLILAVITSPASSRFDRIFEEVGLISKSGNTPKLLWEKELKHGRTLYEFDSKGFGLSQFEAKKDQLEAHFKQDIESMSKGRDPSRIQVMVTRERLPAKISYHALAGQVTLAKDSFYLGTSIHGPLQQSLDSLPHMLIAGSTGNGKSNFFKQVVRSLLESTQYLQVYAIDLKGGLEMVDFARCPNVKIIKSMEQAVMTLRQIKAEMDKRFAYLEKAGFKSISPERDGKDRIVLCIDEASVLYTRRHSKDLEYKIAQEARALTDAIAKLSRAAKINLILATQKLTAEVLPTSITENIAGRMCFRTESIPGSLLVLNTRDATDLPDVKGRGIWSSGSKQTIVQTPFISDEHIQKFACRIEAEFKNGVRKCLEPMIDEYHDAKTKRSKKIIGAERQSVAEVRGDIDERPKNQPVDQQER